MHADMPIVFRHYIGSWESYSARDDARDETYHGRMHWESRSMGTLGGPDDEIRPWIKAFVDLVGEGTAEYLLEGAGVLPNRGRDGTYLNATTAAAKNNSTNLDAAKTAASSPSSNMSTIASSQAAPREFLR